MRISRPGWRPCSSRRAVAGEALAPVCVGASQTKRAFSATRGSTCSPLTSRNSTDAGAGRRLKKQTGAVIASRSWPQLLRQPPVVDLVFLPRIIRKHGQLRPQRTSRHDRLANLESAEALDTDGFEKPSASGFVRIHRSRAICFTGHARAGVRATSETGLYEQSARRSATYYAQARVDWSFEPLPRTQSAPSLERTLAHLAFGHRESHLRHQCGKARVFQAGV